MCVCAEHPPSMHPFLLYFLISVAFHLFFYVFWRKAVARSEKALAWGLTLEISSLYTLLGVHWLWAFCTSLARGTTLVLLKGTTPFDSFCVLFMMGYLFVDLTVGVLHYRAQLRFDTTYAHHFAYFGLELFCLLNGYARYYLIFAILELPTAVLALGCVAQEMRNDTLFQWTFVGTRIVYEVFVVVALLLVKAPIPLHLLAPPVFASLAMHVMWMRPWFLQKAPKDKL